jgi:hypothetical protein
MNYQTVEKPIIYCADGDPAEYVRETKSGLVIASGDFQSLVESIIFLTENRKDAIDMGKNERLYVNNNLW